MGGFGVAPKDKEGGNVVILSARWLMGCRPAWPRNEEIFEIFFKNFNR
jgi:hypothetical protein